MLAALPASVPSADVSAVQPALVGTLLRQSYTVQQPGSGEMRHGTEGWRCLETSFQVCSSFVLGKVCRGNCMPVSKACGQQQMQTE